MRYVAFCLLIFTLFMSCEKLDKVSEPSMTSDLDGKWALQSVRCFCFFPDDFDFSVHQLEFDTMANEVRVDNSEGTNFVTGSGTYPFTIQNDSIVIKERIAYTYQIDGTILILTFIDDPQLADDEISLVYSKL
ncbi:hypothetical protein [Maribacter sp. 2307UL18-2]|uniref:hypothetical protein n=1 Tax=Maribacter sp. 2307UL18-2 TaxID=3386274 RepID=UPI0039BD5BCC